MFQIAKNLMIARINVIYIFNVHMTHMDGYSDAKHYLKRVAQVY